MNPQTKPAHKPTYRERVLAGQVKPKPRARIKPVAKRKQSRDAGWLQPEYRGVQRQPGHPQPFTLLP